MWRKGVEKEVRDCSFYPFPLPKESKCLVAFISCSKTEAKIVSEMESAFAKALKRL